MARATKIANTLGTRIESVMQEKGMTQRGLARAVGIRQQSVFYLLRGTKGVAPRSRHIAKIADVLGVDPLWLETGLGDRRGSGVVTSGGERIGKRIPIKTADNVLDPTLPTQREMTADVTDDGAFGWDVMDAAMEPDVLRGDRLVVSPTMQPKPGNLVLAVVDGSVWLRGYRLLGTGKDARYELVARHPDHPSFDSKTSKSLIVGVVTEQRRFVLTR